MKARSFTLAAGVVLTAAAGAVVSCRDTGTAPPDGAQHARGPTSPPAASAGRGTASTHSPSDGASLTAAREQLHRNNPMNWVGIAHNRALDDLLKELRKPGVLSRDVCQYLLEFVSSDARVPVDRAGLRRAAGATARREVGRKALRATALCSQRFDRRASALPARVSLAAYYSPRPPFGSASLQSGSPSAAAYGLLEQILAAIDAAVDSYDLAWRLHPVLNAASQLDAIERATIEATVSVAQSSYEYWEAQLPTYVQAVSSEYDPCLYNQWSQGYSYDSSLGNCVNGAGAVFQPLSYSPRRAQRHSRSRRAAHGRDALFSAGAVPLRARGVSQSVGEGLKDIGKADAYGAFTGAFAGAFAGGPQGAVLGGIVGAAGASIATALGHAIGATWRRYK
jgi:hypothetical protein